MNLFTNTVTLRGFLGKNAEAPSSGHIQTDSFAVLSLATVAGTWDISTNEWTPRTDWHRIICPGPYLCGMVRGMGRGDYLEVEGELRGQGSPKRGSLDRTTLEPSKSSNADSIAGMSLDLWVGRFCGCPIFANRYYWPIAAYLPR